MSSLIQPFSDQDADCSQHWARIIPLRGFSGCRVVLVEAEDDAYVRKASKDLAYNGRLLKQAEKQKVYGGNAHFQSAKIRAFGCLPTGIAFIDMDYVPGITAAEKLEVLPLAEIRAWSSMLMHFADAGEGQGALPPAIFHEKILSLEAQIREKGYMTPAIAQTLDVLLSRPWTGIPQTPCHGDLTLENIIVHDGRFFLIDFLDSFADSWYLDIAKLFQDLVGGWSFRHKAVDRNLLLRLSSLRNSLEVELEAKHRGCLAPIHDLYALHLLRILPYASSPDDRSFVEDRLAAALASFLKRSSK